MIETVKLQIKQADDED